MDRDLFPDVELVDATPLLPTEDNAAHYGCSCLPATEIAED